MISVLRLRAKIQQRNVKGGETKQKFQGCLTIALQIEDNTEDFANSQRQNQESVMIVFPGE